MAIEIKELTIKLSIEESEQGFQNEGNIKSSDLKNLKEAIIEETIEQVMNQIRSNKDR